MADEPALSPQELKGALGFVAEGFAEMKPEKAPVAEEVAADGVPRDTSTADVRRGLTLLQKSFTFSAFSETSKNITVESDPYHVPGGELVRGKITWTSAKTADNKNIIDAKGSEAERLGELSRVADSRIELTTGAAGSVQQVEGSLTVHYPKAMGLAEFPAADMTSQKRLQTVTCRLMGVENDLVAVWCSGRGNGITLYPVSAVGAVLVSSESIMGPYSVYREVKKTGQVPASVLASLGTTLDQVEKDGVALVMKVKGKVAKVVALEPGQFQDETIKIEAARKPDFDKECPAAPHARYARSTTPPRFATIDESAIKSGTEIRPARSEAMIGFNEQMVRIRLPRLGNSLLAQVTVKNVVLKKGAKKLKFEAQGPFRDDDGYGFTYRMESGDSGNGKPVEFDKATGTVEVRYPVKVTTRKVPAAADDRVVKVKDCSVQISGNSVDADPRAVWPSVRAIAANGMPLKLVRDFSESGSTNGNDYKGLRFWGVVTAVEVDEVSEWKTVSLPLNLSPAPPLQRQ